MADLLSDPGVGDDPAAEFLTREQDELGELGAEFDEKLDVNDTPGSDGDFQLIQQSSQEPMQLVNGFSEEPSMMTTPVIQQQEPESLRKWREEKAALLAQNEAEEQAEHEIWLEKAKKDLDDWYSRYDEQLQKVKHENREAEEAFVEDMTSTKPGNEWERVARLCEFNPKNSKNTKDVARMRSILLHMKQNPLVR